MRARIRFSKFGSMKYLGHLDVMRYFQKVIRRTDLDVCYSEGFHPHQIMSFAQPLSVSLTSDGEYFDVEFRSEHSEAEILEKLSAAMGDEFALSRVTRLNDYVKHTKKVTSMSLIHAAAYYIEAKPSVPVSAEHVRRLAEAETFPVLRKTKSSEREYDLMTGIHEIWRLEDGKPVCLRASEPSLFTEELWSMGLAHCDREPSGTGFACLVDAGSEKNVSAELVAGAVSRLAGIPYRALDYHVHRMELFGTENGKVVPLWKIVL